MLALYWAVAAKRRKYVLAVVSLAFYGLWHWQYLALLIGVAIVNHVGAIWVSRGELRKPRVAVVVAIDITVLGLFKYAAWLCSAADDGFAALGMSPPVPVPHWMLPLGISFFIFEGMSYVIDVGRKREKPHGALSTLVFIAFFPKLIAGPILRAKELLPQIEREDAALSASDIVLAAREIAIGLFLKVVVADGIAQFVDAAWARDPATLSMTDVWVMACAFGMQIYFDFSSYSRIAIGSARLLGIRLVDNFDHPYTSPSPAAFWSRWHMSLSRWIRDYVFFPVAGPRPSLARLCGATIVAMTLCGLWHGAATTFVLWGVWHGVLVAATHLAERIAPNPEPGLARRAAQIGATFAAVSLGWIFFRANSIDAAISLFTRALSPWHRGHVLPGTLYLLTALLTAAVFAARPLTSLIARRAASGAPSLAGEVASGIAIGLAAAMFFVYLRGQTAFIYFQF